jgi:hypothetical protein
VTSRSGSPPALLHGGQLQQLLRVDVDAVPGLPVADYALPVPTLEMIRYQSLDAHLECLGERVAEYLRGRLIPEYYLLGRRIGNYDRVPDPLEEFAYP